MIDGLLAEGGGAPSASAEPLGFAPARGGEGENSLWLKLRGESNVAQWPRGSTCRGAASRGPTMQHPHSPCFAGLGFLLCSAGCVLAYPVGAAAELGARSVALAAPDVLPIAVVLGAGVLTWLLGNRRPRLQPAPARKPKAPSRKRPIKTE